MGRARDEFALAEKARAACRKHLADLLREHGAPPADVRTAAPRSVPPVLPPAERASGSSSPIALFEAW